MGCSFTAPTLRSDGHLELLAQAKHLRVNTRYISQVIHGVIDGVKVSSSLSLINPVTKVNTAREKPKRTYKIICVNVTASAVVAHATANNVCKLWWHFAIFLNNAIGLITPPVGTVLNAVAGVGKISMDEVTRGVLPFMVAQFIIMFAMVAFPALVMVPARWFY